MKERSIGWSCEVDHSTTGDTWAYFVKPYGATCPRLGSRVGASPSQVGTCSYDLYENKQPMAMLYVALNL